MTDTNAAVFQVANEVLSEAVIDTFGGSVQEFRAELVRFLSGYSGAMFGILSNFHFDIDGSRPEFLGYEGAAMWRALDADYSIRKLKEGHSTSFYERTGDLRAHIQGLNATALYGKPRVTVGMSGTQTNPDVFIDRGGRPQWRPGSGRRGFASYKDSFANLSVTLFLRMFPRAQGQSIDQLIAMSSSGWNTFKWSKLETGGKHQPPRPMLVPFMRWYSTTNLRMSLSENFGVEIQL